MRGLRYSPLARLKRKHEFERVFARGKSVRQNGIELGYLANRNLKCSRLGVVISRRAFRQASVRNRLKRLAREFFRLNQGQFRSHHEIVIRFMGFKASEIENNCAPETLRALFKDANVL